MSVPLVLLRETELAGWLQREGGAAALWASTHGFTAERGRTLAIPDESGRVRAVLAGLGAMRDADLNLWHAAALTERLPAGLYSLAASLPAAAATQFLLGSLVSQYRFTRLKTQARDRELAHLEPPAHAD